jgi:Cof subfamily protein (haloacid dehalogenase superfamily)
MSYRLVAIDLDGTLLTPDKGVSPRTRAALYLAAAAGCAIVIATGRSFPILAMYCGGIPLTAPQITYNGAVVCDPASGQELRRTLLPPEAARLTAEFFLQADIPLALFTPQRLYIDQRIPNGHLWSPPPLPPPLDLGDVREHLNLPIIKLAGYSPAETMGPLQAAAEEALGHVGYVTRTAKDLLEVMHPAVSKGEALQEIAGMLGIERHEIVAFGDSHNDLTLFEYAGLSVAMGNSTPDIQAGADMVAPSNEEDGVAQVLEELFRT